jgi:hypothetical protein
LAQAFQHLWLVFCDDVYRAFTWVRHAIHPSPVSVSVLTSRATATGLCNRRLDDTGLCTGLQGGDPGHPPPSNRVAGRVIALSKSYYNLGAAPAERAGDVAVSARDTKPCWCGEARYRTSAWEQPGTRRLARRVLAGAYWTHNVLYLLYLSA